MTRKHSSAFIFPQVKLHRDVSYSSTDHATPYNSVFLWDSSIYPHKRNSTSRYILQANNSLFPSILHWFCISWLRTVLHSFCMICTEYVNISLFIIKCVFMPVSLQFWWQCKFISPHVNDCWSFTWLRLLRLLCVRSPKLQTHKHVFTLLSVKIYTFTVRYIKLVVIMCVHRMHHNICLQFVSVPHE